MVQKNPLSAQKFSPYVLRSYAINLCESSKSASSSPLSPGVTHEAAQENTATHLSEGIKKLQQMVAQLQRFSHRKAPTACQEERPALLEAIELRLKQISCAILEDYQNRKKHEKCLRQDLSTLAQALHYAIEKIEAFECQQQELFQKLQDTLLEKMEERFLKKLEEVMQRRDLDRALPSRGYLSSLEANTGPFSLDTHTKGVTPEPSLFSRNVEERVRMLAQQLNSPAPPKQETMRPSTTNVRKAALAQANPEPSASVPKNWQDALAQLFCKMPVQSSVQNTPIAQRRNLKRA